MENYKPIRRRDDGGLPVIQGGPALQPIREIEVPFNRSLTSAHPSAPQPGLLQSYFRVISRNRGKILLFAALGIVAGLLFTLGKAPMYRVRTSLDVQSLNENFMNMRAVDPSGASGNYSAESNLQTHMRLIESDMLLNRVVHRLEAESNTSVPNRDLFSQFAAKLGILHNPSTPRDVLVARTAKSVKAKPIGLTRLIEITCESQDPGIAAEFCNTLAKEYVDQDYEIRAETAQQTNSWLTRQVADVRSDLERKESKLLAYARDNKILFNQETDSVNQEKLKQDQMELSRAEADRIAKQSSNDLLNSANADSLPPVLDSGPLKTYQEKLTELLRQKADLTQSLTPSHPKVLHIQAQIDELQSSINKEKANILGRIRNEYTAARNRERLLKDGYNQQEGVVAKEIAKEGQFNQLKHDVDSERQIYDTLMQHVREAGLLSMIRTSPVRIVDKADSPRAPFSPNRPVSAIVGFLLGSLCGLGFVFWSDRTTPKLRAPGDTRMAFNVRELGVIPSSRLNGKAAAGAGLELVTSQKSQSLMAESYRATMNSILFGLAPGKGASVIVVSSPNVGEGKTSLVCNLSIALAETRRRVILIDGDLRRPRLHDVFKLSNEFGISNALAGERDVSDLSLDALVQPTAVTGLSVIASGSHRGAAISTLLHGKTFEDLLARLRRECDLILIDTPPLLHISDARIIARHADGTVLVFRSGLTTCEDASSVQNILAHDSVRVLGTVLNDFNPGSEGRYGYYKSYYAYKS